MKKAILVLASLAGVAAMAVPATASAAAHPPRWLMNDAKQDAKQVAHRFWYGSPSQTGGATL